VKTGDCNQRFTFIPAGARYRFIAMHPESQSRQFSHLGTVVQGAIVVGVGIYAMFLLFYWLFTN
jgi:hypothetical protein